MNTLAQMNSSVTGGPPGQAVIFCGGRGERLRPLTDGLPKPLAPVLGRPFLEYLVEQLRDAGIGRVLLLTGYRGDQIREHFGAGAGWGTAIEYHQGPEEWETGRRLAEAAALLEEQFLLLYADNLAPIRLETLWQHHQQSGLPLTVTVSPKEKGNIRLGKTGVVEMYDPARTQEDLRHVEIGYMTARRDAVMAMDPGRGSFSLVLQELAASGQLAAFNPGCFYCSISEMARLREMEEYLRPRRLLLLDRDGVINRKAPRGEYVSRREAFTWIGRNLEGLRQLAGEGFEFMILTNQAGIGRGVMEAAAVDELHAWMVRELCRQGIGIQDVLMCPHHWEDDCACRKPRPGLFYQASLKHRFWLGRTIYVGDDPRDAEAAWNAACPCLLLGPAQHPAAGAETVRPHREAADLADAVPWILERFNAWGSGQA